MLQRRVLLRCGHATLAHPTDTASAALRHAWTCVRTHIGRAASDRWRQLSLGRRVALALVNFNLTSHLSMAKTKMHSRAVAGAARRSRPSVPGGIGEARRRYCAHGAVGTSVQTPVHMSMRACLFTCLCTCPFTCPYTCPFTCLYTFLYACLHTCLFTCLYTCIYTCLYTCLYACMFTCLYTYPCTCPYTCPCPCPCLYTCSYTCSLGES